MCGVGEGGESIQKIFGGSLFFRTDNVETHKYNIGLQIYIDFIATGVREWIHDFRNGGRAPPGILLIFRSRKCYFQYFVG